MYATFIFESLKGTFHGDDKDKEVFEKRVQMLNNFFLNIKNDELLSLASVILAKVRLLKELERMEEAYETLSAWIKENKNVSEAMRIEHVKLLIELQKKDEVIVEAKHLLENLNQTLTKHYCHNCGFNSDEIFWRCPQCHNWETIQFRWKV